MKVSKLAQREFYYTHTAKSVMTSFNRANTTSINTHTTPSQTIKVQVDMTIAANCTKSSRSDIITKIPSQVWTEVRPARIKWCHMVLYDGDWKLHVRCGEFKYEITVDDSKDLRIELYDGHAEVHVLNDSSFTENFVRATVYFDGRPGALERHDATSIPIPAMYV